MRERLIGGDLRALYMLWLCAAYDDNEDPAEMIEPPVPHGLDKMPARSARMLPFFGVDPLILKVAAQGIPDSKPVQDDQDRQGPSDTQDAQVVAEKQGLLE